MTERIQLLDDLGAEFARVAAEAERTPRKPSRRAGRLIRPGLRVRTLTIALGIAALLCGVAYAVPATRTAVDGVVDSFAAWVSGDRDNPPGRPLERGDSVPAWFTEDGEVRLVAKTDGVGLYVRRVESGEGPRLEFGLGEGIGIAMEDTLQGWRQRFGEHDVVLLGSTLFGPQDVLDERGRFPLLGLSTRDVSRVELRYSEGPPLFSRTGDGGFVLLVDAWRPLRDLIAYDATGRVLERIDVRDHDARYLCEKEPGVCPIHAPSNKR
jgi:hypothetical protein